MNRGDLPECGVMICYIVSNGNDYLSLSSFKNSLSNGALIPATVETLVL